MAVSPSWGYWEGAMQGNHLESAGRAGDSCFYAPERCSSIFLGAETGIFLDSLSTVTSSSSASPAGSTF